jgi:hypothetical protein
MAVILKNLGYPIPGMATPHEGQYLRDMDFEAHDGRGLLSVTSDITKAKQFPSAVEAFEYLKQVPKCHPIRPDLQPNRPLTGFNWELLNV